MSLGVFLPFFSCPVMKGAGVRVPGTPVVGDADCGLNAHHYRESCRCVCVMEEKKVETIVDLLTPVPFVYLGSLLL